MIINDIILENRALEPLELTVIGQLKTKRPSAGAMFSEVGSYLSQDQFRCLLRWIMTKSNPTIVRRADGSTPPPKVQGLEGDWKLNPKGQVTGTQKLPVKPKVIPPKLNDPTNLVPQVPKLVAPIKGTGIEKFRKQLKWPSLDAFIAAHKGKVNKNKTGTKWVVHPNQKYSTYQPSPTESTTIDSEQLVFEMNLYLENNNEIILEGVWSEITKRITTGMAGVVSKIGKSGIQTVTKDGVKEVVKGSDEWFKSLKAQSDKADDLVLNAIKNADDNGEVLVKDALKNANKLERETIENQTKELSKAIEKRLLTETKLADDAAKKLANTAAKNIRYNSGLTMSEWVKNGLERFIRAGFYAIVKPIALLIPEISEQQRKNIKRGKELAKKWKHFQSIKVPGGEKLSKCDHDAHKIREILRSHGWLMSPTPTGY